jgi:hypothetical protein
VFPDYNKKRQGQLTQDFKTGKTLLSEGPLGLSTKILRSEKFLEKVRKL